MKLVKNNIPVWDKSERPGAPFPAFGYDPETLFSLLGQRAPVADKGFTEKQRAKLEALKTNRAPARKAVRP